MACKKDSVPFGGTPEQELALKKVIAELKDTKSPLMPIMQQAQEIYGYHTRVRPGPRHAGHSPGEDLRHRDLLFNVFASAQGQIPDFRVPGNCLLRQRFWHHLQ